MALVRKQMSLVVPFVCDQDVMITSHWTQGLWTYSHSPYKSPCPTVGHSESNIFKPSHVQEIEMPRYHDHTILKNTAQPLLQFFSVMTQDKLTLPTNWALNFDDGRPTSLHLPHSGLDGGCFQQLPEFS